MFDCKIRDHHFGTKVEHVILPDEFPFRIRALPLLGERSFDVAIELIPVTVVRIEILGVVERERSRLVGRLVDALVRRDRYPDGWSAPDCRLDLFLRSYPRPPHLPTLRSPPASRRSAGSHNLGGRYLNDCRTPCSGDSDFEVSTFVDDCMVCGILDVGFSVMEF